jgi:acyl carrier protein
MTTPSPLEPLSFEAFQTILAELIDADVSRLRPETYFITDLGLDSLRMVEVLLRLEELGVEISPDMAWRIHTVGDAYRCYQGQVDR